MAMVINGINNGGIYYTSDLGDIIVKGISGKLTVRYSISSYTITESYSSGSENSVTIKDIGKVIDSYFVFKDFKKSAVEYIHEPLIVQFVFTDNLGTSSVTIRAVYSKALTGMLPDNSRIFLSRYKIVRTNKNRLEYVTFFKANGMKLMVGVAYLALGKAKFKKITLSVTSKLDCIYTRLISLKSISSSAGVGVDSILFYEAYLFKDDVMVDKIRYDIIKDKINSEVNFVYRNPFGGFETLAFAGYITDMPENDASINVFIDRQKRNNTSVKEIRKVYSGYINSEKYNAVKDMLLSSDVLVLDKESEPKAIVISESEMERTFPSNEVSGISVTYYPALNSHYGFDRKPNVAKRIFDKTFDYTFD